MQFSTESRLRADAPPRFNEFDAAKRTEATRAGRKIATSKTIESIADKIEELALAASMGRAKYQEFESQLGELHAAGFYPEMSLISDVAHAMV